MAVTKTNRGLSDVDESVAVTGTFWQDTQPVSATSWPLPTGASTAANQGKWYGITSGLVGWKEAGGKPRVSTMPYLFDIAEMNVAGHKPWTKAGFNPDVDAAAPEDIWTGGGTIVMPTANTAISFVSTSVEDDPDKGGAVPGTGLHTLRLVYLDSLFAEKTVTITLNGTTPVAGPSDFYRPISLRAMSAGTTYNSVGTITAYQTTGAAPTYMIILPNQTTSIIGFYTVPAGKAVYITSVTISVGCDTSGNVANVTIRSTHDYESETTIPNLFFSVIGLSLQDAAFHREFEVPIHLPAGTDLKGTASVQANNARISYTLRGWIEDV